MVKAMKQLNITEAKAQFSQLVTNAACGESTVIARGGRPVAKIVPFDGIPSKIKFGTFITVIHSIGCSWPRQSPSHCIS